MGGGRSAALIRFALLSVRAGGAGVLPLGAGSGAAGEPSHEHCAKTKQLASATNCYAKPGHSGGRAYQEAGAARLRRHGHILRVFRVPFDDFVSLASMWQT